MDNNHTAQHTGGTAQPNSLKNRIVNSKFFQNDYARSGAGALGGASIGYGLNSLLGGDSHSALIASLLGSVAGGTLGYKSKDWLSDNNAGKKAFLANSLLKYSNGEQQEEFSEYVQPEVINDFVKEANALNKYATDTIFTGPLNAIDDFATNLVTKTIPNGYHAATRFLYDKDTRPKENSMQISNQTRRALIGAGVGTGLGAGAGYLAKDMLGLDPTLSAGLGAGAGALLGGAAGYYIPGMMNHDNSKKAAIHLEIIAKYGDI